MFLKGDEFMGLGSKIKAARKSKGMTQKQLAEKVGLSTITIRQYENELRKPKYGVAESIAKALQCETSDLLSSSEETEMIYAHLIDRLNDSVNANENRQKAAEAAIDGDYQVYLLNFLIQNADVLSLLQHAGYKIEVIDKTNVAIKGFMVTHLMTTSDFVEKVSRFSKASEDLINSFPTMAKEADDNAPQDNP